MEIRVQFILLLSKCNTLHKKQFCYRSMKINDILAILIPSSKDMWIPGISFLICGVYSLIQKSREMWQGENSVIKVASTSYILINDLYLDNKQFRCKGYHDQHSVLFCFRCWSPAAVQDAYPSCTKSLLLLCSSSIVLRSIDGKTAQFVLFSSSSSTCSTKTKHRREPSELQIYMIWTLHIIKLHYKFKAYTLHSCKLSSQRLQKFSI